MFKFKLKSLLTLKENLEEAKKRELGLLNFEQQQKHRELEVLQDKIRNSYEELRRNGQGQINFTTIQDYQRYLLKQQSEEKKLKDSIVILENKIELKKDELLEAVKERKILENLQEMKKQEYAEEEKQKEQKIVDEIVSYKYTQKSQGEADA